MTLQPIATLLLALKLYAHRAHHLTKGSTFFSDHETLGAFYSAYDSAYDSIAERIVGLGQPVDLSAVAKDAAARSAISVANPFATLLSLEKELCTALTLKASIGTMNLLAQLADDSEVRQYKLKQRTNQ